MTVRAVVGGIRRRRRLAIWSGLALVLGIWLGQLPLFGVLGFELAMAAALFAAVMGLDVGSALARERQRATGEPTTTAGPARTMVRTTLAAVKTTVAIAFIPAAVAVVRSLWTPSCDWGFGLKTYLAMPIATAALAGALGHVLGVISGPRRFAGAALAQLPAVLLVLAGLWRFYSEPPVFIYNAIVGYFPGALYDENIQLRWPFVWSRIEQLAWVVAVVAQVGAQLDVARHRMRWRAKVRQRAASIVAAIAAATATVLHLQSGALGYGIDAEDIADGLGSVIETEHFIIHYSRGDTDDDSSSDSLEDDVADDIELIARDHEFRYAQIVAQVGAAPEGKLRSYYFRNAAQKVRWFGARNYEMAKPWRREIYLSHRPFPHSSLRHEIAHSVASAFGDPLFGVATRHGVMVNPGLVEGIAVATDWPGSYDDLTPHEDVRAMQEMGLQPAIRQLFSLGFLSVSSSRGYATAGSFVRFLLDRYGADKLRTLYRTGGDFAAAYATDLGVLEAEWIKMIGTIALPPEAVEAQREQFRRAGVFSRPCPHAVAARRDDAYAAFRDGDRAKGIALFRRVCDLSPDESYYRVELAGALIQGDPAERIEGEAIWNAVANDVEGVTSTLRASVLDRLATLAAQGGDRAKVEARTREALALPIDVNQRRRLEVDLFALEHRGPAARALYAFSFLPAPLGAAVVAQWAVMLEPQLGLAHYLLGVNNMRPSWWRNAAQDLDRALTLGLPNQRFVRNAARQLAVAAYRSGDVARVERAIALLSGPDMTTGDHLLAEDWRARLAFDAVQRR